MKTSIVLGLCFGDEGKGSTTSFLSSSPATLVVRFNGGHQAGHTVVKNGYRHVFSSFGAGTLNGAHTYWSEYCTFCPVTFFNERNSLVSAGYRPTFLIHPLSMVTTPFDKEWNQKTEKNLLHGSVGVGFGATIARHTETPYKLFVVDLFYKPLLIHKLYQIAKYYGVENPKEQINNFLLYINTSHYILRTLSEIKDSYKNIVFEGAQGIMLDMDFGFFPNVTRSNTTSKNAFQIIKDNDLPMPTVYYVMRSYLTRHGNGFMPNETAELSFPDKTNITHEFQGSFRQGYHSSQMLDYALRVDFTFSINAIKTCLVVTCMDQTNDRILIDGDHCEKHKIHRYIDALNFNEAIFVDNEAFSIPNKELA